MIKNKRLVLFWDRQAHIGIGVIGSGLHRLILKSQMALAEAETPHLKSSYIMRHDRIERYHDYVPTSPPCPA